MINLRPSSSEKWVNCPASAKLEQGYPNIQTASASEGIYAHEVAEWCLKNNISPGDLRCKITPKGMRKHVQAYINYINDISKDKQLYVEYPISLYKPFGIKHHGKIDSLCITPNEIFIIDFKYGKWSVNAFNNYQLLMYAYAVFTSKDFVFNTLESITLTIIQPRVACTVSSWKLNKKEFIENIQPIKNAIEKVNSDTPPYNPGKHCMFCKAKKTCTIKPKGIEFKSKVTFENEYYA